jgi:hypothetical protein
MGSEGAGMSGSNNVAVGTFALAYNTTASSNTAVGYQAGYANTTGANSVFIGNQAGTATTTASFITAVGNRAAYSNTTGTDNVAVGAVALNTNTTGGYNTALGNYALYSNTTASNNTAVGYQAGYSNTTGTTSTVMGRQAGYSNTTGANTLIGDQAGYFITTGTQNVGVGRYVLNANAGTNTGNYNVAVGDNALLSNTTASNNTAVGYQAGYSNTTGTRNTLIGEQSGRSITTNSFNTFVGNHTGENTTGGYNTFLGDYAGYLVTTGTRHLILGKFDGNSSGLDIRTASNYIVLADGDGNLRQVIDSSGNLLVGATSTRSSAKLDIRGNVIALGENATYFGTIDYSAGAGFLSLTAESGGGIKFLAGTTERMRIDTSGNVGIGTSSPSAKLQVNWTSGSNTALFQTSAVGQDVGLQIQSTATNGGNWAITTSDSTRGGLTNSLAFQNKGASTAPMLIDSSGNLCVGRSSVGVGDRFVVQTTSSGTIMLGYNSSATNTFQILDSGNVRNTNNSYGAISDAKIKENVVDATPKLDKLNQVRVVNFNLIGDEQKQIGVIAQELEQIFPSMVEESPDRDVDGNDLGTVTKSVKYSVFVPMLIKAIQEQQALIENLTTRLAALEAR